MKACYFVKKIEKNGYIEEKVQYQFR